jgi:hypothetical protein
MHHEASCGITSHLEAPRCILKHHIACCILKHPEASCSI